MTTRSIALLTNRFAPSIGGVEAHVAAVAEGLSQGGHNVTVLTHQLTKDSPRRENRGRVQIARFPVIAKSENFKMSPSLARYLRSNGAKFDLIHAHGYHDSPALIAAIATNRPLVFTPHFHTSTGSKGRDLLHRAYSPLGDKIFERSSAIICVSAAEERSILAKFPSAEGRTFVVSNGVDAAHFRDAEAVEDASGKRVILVAGRLHDYKQVDRVIEAMIFLRHDFVMKVVGEGPERENLEWLARTLGLEQSITFCGNLPDDEFAQAVKSASVVVSMSTLEAQGIILLEAAAAGTPSVASNIDAHLDVAASVPGAITTIDATTTPGPLAEAIAASSIRRVSAKVPTWEDATNSIEAIYELVLSDSLSASFESSESVIGI